MIKQVPTEKCEVVVYPRNPGNFGSIRIGGMTRTPEEEYRLCQDIEKDIKRHVDDVETAYVRREYKYQTVDGDEFETKYEALEYLYASEDFRVRGFDYRYERPSDNGVGTSGRVYDFKKVIEEAYDYPWNFEVSEIFSEEEKVFLDNVIKAGLENKQKKAN